MRQSIVLSVWKAFRFFGELPSPRMAAARMCADESNRVALLGGIEKSQGPVRADQQHRPCTPRCPMTLVTFQSSRPAGNMDTRRGLTANERSTTGKCVFFSYSYAVPDRLQRCIYARQ